MLQPTELTVTTTALVTQKVAEAHTTDPNVVMDRLGHELTHDERETVHAFLQWVTDKRYVLSFTHFPALFEEFLSEHAASGKDTGTARMF